MEESKEKNRDILFDDKELEELSDEPIKNLSEEDKKILNESKKLSDVTNKIKKFFISDDKRA